MNARPGGDRRTVLIASGSSRLWTLHGLCRDDLRFSDGPFDRSVTARILAEQLAHRCRVHCPVVEQCAASVIEQAPLRPRKAVRAGVFFPDSGPPRVLDNCECGSHCEGLPWAHRKAVES